MRTLTKWAAIAAALPVLKAARRHSLAEKIARKKGLTRGEALLAIDVGLYDEGLIDGLTRDEIMSEIGERLAFYELYA